MSLLRSTAIALRIIHTMRRDRRTLALLIAMPVVVMALIGLSFQDQPGVLNGVAPALLGFFPLFMSFLLTGIAFLRERSGGTLDRLLATPVTATDLLVGYLLGFVGFALVQAIVVLGFTVYILQVQFQASVIELLVFLAVLTVTGVCLGIFFSTFARNEFQIVQFIPLFFAPQVFLSGLFLPVEQMPRYLQAIAVVLPLRYAIDGLRAMMLRGAGLPDVGRELSVLVAIGVVALILGSITARRV